MPHLTVLRVVPTMASRPGGCSLCNNDQRVHPLTGERERMIDTGIDLDFGEGPERVALDAGIPGRVFVVCESCGAEFADNLGWTSPTRTAEMRAEIEALKDRLQATIIDLDAAQSVNRATAGNAAAIYGPPRAVAATRA